MRLPIQGCLILLLFFSSSQYVMSDDIEWGSGSSYEGLYKYPYNCDGYASQSCDAGVASGATSMFKYYRWRCSVNGQYLVPNGIKTHSGGQTVPNYEGQCSIGPPPPECSSPNIIHPETGECVSPKEPEDCLEIGEFYNPGTQSCVAECPSGFWPLNSYCVGSDDPELESCNSESEDFRGNVNQGFGNAPLAICGDTTCTIGGKPGQSGIFNNELVCLADDYGAPKCQGDTITVIEEYGFICAGIDDDSESPPTDSSEGDSDGDGEGDLTGIAGQLQDIKNLLGKGNDNTANSEELLKGIGNRITDGTKSITDAIGNIPGGGGGSGSSGQTEIVGEDGNAISWGGDAIDTELTDPSDDYDQVMADYQAKINEIKAEVLAMFSTSLTGGGSVDDDIKTIKGVEVNFSLNRFLSGLDILGAIVLFCAAFISAGILFTSRG
ncbi:hypothetical protein [Marinobacter sp. 2_MG-2023]|uniref:hypothetical protein n=1 Tax=Marinobacter sp. 2_MG-2023 TaxID=3062679 RepID=UPI0026E248AE|nr:hypothetical protein [Marinobacter sp. 2_MG-2023]MDO6444128.1 hypothetical protein [Marinobacter sp. 2_MG-2023]